MTTELEVQELEAQEIEAPKKNKAVVWIIVIIVLVIAYTQLGLFSVQPIGALPEGVTLLVLRPKGRPFLDSPDRLCLDTMGGVNLLCRGMAISAAVENYTIISKLPFMNWAYTGSTKGMIYE
jgi:hypothetical protein